MDQMNEAVEAACNNHKMSNHEKILHGIKRTSQQLKRKYLEGGGSYPRDSALQHCVFCQHPTVDEPQENQNVGELKKE